MIDPVLGVGLYLAQNGLNASHLDGMIYVSAGARVGFRLHIDGTQITVTRVMSNDRLGGVDLQDPHSLPELVRIINENW